MFFLRLAAAAAAVETWKCTCLHHWSHHQHHHHENLYLFHRHHYHHQHHHHHGNLLCCTSPTARHSRDELNRLDWLIRFTDDKYFQAPLRVGSTAVNEILIGSIPSMKLLMFKSDEKCLIPEKVLNRPAAVSYAPQLVFVRKPGF